MSKRKKRRLSDISVDPEARVAALHDSTGIRKTETAHEDMGVRVVDNCPEEHIM